jgi:hypothetical protein
MDVMGWSNSAMVKRYAHVTAWCAATSRTGSTAISGAANETQTEPGPQIDGRAVFRSLEPQRASSTYLARDAGSWLFPGRDRIP